MTGRTISHYRIEGRLGEGGMGVVYAAIDTKLGRRVAVKFCRPGRDDQGGREELVREARAASKLNHPNIAQIYDLGETEEGLPFFVMEYIDGQNLAQQLRSGPLEWPRAVRVAREVACALSEAHRHGIIHRDIKPGNIVGTGNGVIKVLDFGLARMLEMSTTKSLAPDQLGKPAPGASVAGQLKGTPGYVSPEQSLGGAVDHRTDLFSLGCVLYECLTGARPFLADTLEGSLLRVQTATPRRPSEAKPSLPRVMDGLVLRLLEKDPADRYQTAEELMAALDSVPGVQAPRLPWQRRWGIGVGVLAVVLAGVAGYKLWNAPYEPGSEVRRWYTDGLTAMRDGTYLKASRAFEQAVQQDPGFALAQAHLAEAWFEMDYSDRARESLLRAKRLAPEFRGLRRAEALTVEAIDFMLTGDFEQSLQRYATIVKEAPKEERAWALLDLGRAYDRHSQASKALDAYREAVKASGQCAACLLRLAANARRMRLFPEAERALDQAKPLYVAASNVEGTVEVQYTLALVHFGLGKKDLALREIEDALEAARAAGNVQQQVKLLLQRANFWVNEGNVTRAHEEAQQAVDLARAQGIEVLAARSLVQLGNAYFMKSRYSEAEELYRQALGVARRNHARVIEAQALMSLGNLHHTTGAAEKALTELTTAVPLLRQAGYAKDAFDAGILLSRVLRDKGDLLGARHTIEEQARDAEGRKDSADQALAEEGLGTVLVYQEMHSEAAARLRQARQFASEASPMRVGYLLVAEAGQWWRIGAFDHSEALMAEAGRWQETRGLPALAEDLGLERGEMELARGRAAAAVQLLQETYRTLDPKNHQGRVDTLRLLGLAQARGGHAAEGWKFCEMAIAGAAELETPWIVSRARLSCAEAALLAGHREKAAELAVLARKWIEVSGQMESEWRACLLIAAAGVDGRAMLKQARTAMDRLEKSWPPVDWRGYCERADVRRLREQLNQMEELNK